MNIIISPLLAVEVTEHQSAMKFLITVLFGLYTFTVAQSGEPSSIDVGLVHGHAEIGHMQEPYFPLSDLDQVATRNAIHFAEWLRTVFEHGFGPLPPLDPFEPTNVSDIVLKDFADAFLSGIISLSNLELRGAKNFVLDKLEVRLNTSRLDYTVQVPEYDAEVDFDAKILIDKANFEFQGHLSLTATNVTIVGACEAGQFNGVLQLVATTLDIVADDVTIDVQNARRSNGILKSNVIFDAIANAVAESIAQTALLQANDILDHLTISQVMAVILPNP